MMAESRGWGLSEFYEKVPTVDEYRFWRAFYEIYPLPQRREAIRQAELLHFVSAAGFNTEAAKVETLLPPWWVVLSAEEHAERQRILKEAEQIKRKARADAAIAALSQAKQVPGNNGKADHNRKRRRRG